MDEFPCITLGNPSGEVLVFLAGFPDDHVSSFGPVLDAMKKDYYIISLCHPDFETKDSNKRRRWGYDFAELMPMMHRAIRRHAGDRKVTLILHDWGSFTGLLFQNKYPEIVTRVITIDVGLTAKLPPASDLFYITYYQWHFAFFYFISQIFSLELGELLFMLFLGWMRLLPFLSPVPFDVNRPSHRPAAEVTVEMCYPYYWFWRNFFRGNKIAPTFPACPVLFMVSGHCPARPLP
jgi:pimeloyl-ACP methyl ester carboxylesterase